MPISGRYDLPLATFNLPSRNSSQSNRKRIPQAKNLLVPSLLRRHACLTTPVVNTCSRNSSQSNHKRIPPHRHSGISAARRAGLPIGVPPRCRGRFRTFSVTAGAAPDVRNDDEGEFRNLRR